MISLAPSAEVLVLLLTGVGLAFANTLASSGSALSLPVLLSIGLQPELANGTNRVAVFAGTLAAAVWFARAGRVDWAVVRPLSVVAAGGAIAGALLSEVVSPTSLHLAIVGALLIALGVLAIRPSRWLSQSGRKPRVGPIQLLLVSLIGVWAGFIVLDSMTYLLIALVLSVGFDITSANAAKAVIASAMALVSLIVLAAGHNVDWSASAPLATGAVMGGLAAAKIAVKPEAARWIYRLLVLVIVGECAQLALASLRMR